MSRSLLDYTFLPKLRTDELRRMEKEMKSAFEAMLEDYGGTYYSLKVGRGLYLDIFIVLELQCIQYRVTDYFKTAC